MAADGLASKEPVRDMRPRGKNRSLPAAVLAAAAILVLAASFPAVACGWWGDGEGGDDDEAVVIGADGNPVEEDEGPTNPTLGLVSKVPGEIGFATAVKDPKTAVPYLRAVAGRQVNKIGELRALGFITVIDLGTPPKTARLHEAETEALGMRYVSIPVREGVPTPQQISGFIRAVNDTENLPLLVFAPSADLIGVLWESHLRALGAPR